MFFPTHAVTFYEEVEDGAICGFDDYDAPKRCLVEKDTVMVDFQPMSSSDAQKEFGNFVQGAYRMFLEPDVIVKATYKVKVDGFEGYFQVSGEPILRNALIPIQKVMLVREG